MPDGEEKHQTADDDDPVKSVKLCKSARTVALTKVTKAKNAISFLLLNDDPRDVQEVEAGLADFKTKLDEYLDAHNKLCEAVLLVDDEDE